MKTIIAAALLLCIFLTAAPAQQEGFFTRTLKNNYQKAAYIECWRANSQSPTPVRIATEYYDPQGQGNPYYIHWWVHGSGGLQIDCGWDYTFIGWLYENGDTLFSDYSPWTEYTDETVCDTFDLVLQYEFTRPTMPPR